MISYRAAKRAVLIAGLIHLSPALILLAFPFQFAITGGFFVGVGFTSILTLAMYAGIQQLNRDACKNIYCESRRLYSSKHSFISFGSWIGVIAVFTDLFLIKKLPFSFDLNSTRDALTASEATFSSYFALIFSGFSLLNLLLNKRTGYFPSFLPWFIISAMHISTGNRQFFIFGILLLFFSFLLSGRIAKFSHFRNISMLIIGLFFLLLMIQLQRQTFAAGEQAEFIGRLFGIKCVSSSICGTIYEIPLIVIFAYFGTIYPGLESILQSNLSTTPPYSTLPLLYRRLESMQVVDSSYVMLNKGVEFFQNRYGIFPNFWKSMWAGIYSDYSFVGLVVAPMLIFAYVRWLTKRLNKSHDKQWPFVNCCIFFASISFGIMYFPFSENVIFITFMLALLGALFGRMTF